MSETLTGSKRVPFLQLSLLSIVLLFLAISIIIFLLVPFVNSQEATQISLKKWVELDFFTPYIFYPEPETLELRMGPYHISPSDRVELHYTKPFTAGSSTSYDLYESNRSLPEGLVPHYDIPDEDVIEKYITLVMLGNEKEIRIRLNRKRPEDGMAIFEVDGTHVVYYWRNVDQNDALEVLTEHFVSIQQDDVEIINEFDQLLKDRRRAAQATLTTVP